jgi:hypothetical protein
MRLIISEDHNFCFWEETLMMVMLQTKKIRVGIIIIEVNNNRNKINSKNILGALPNG